MEDESKFEEKKKIIHYNHVCGLCFDTPIKGYLFNCLICENFDLCEDCENKGTHEHPCIKIKQNANRNGNIQSKEVNISDNSLQNYYKHNSFENENFSSYYSVFKSIKFYLFFC